MIGVAVLAVLGACASEEDPASAATDSAGSGAPSQTVADAAPADDDPAPEPPAAAAAEPLPEPPPAAAAAAPGGATIAAAGEGEPDLAAEPASTPPAAARQHEVKGVVTQWQPMILFANPGDTVVFRQMAGHDTETIEGLIPDAAQGWKSKMGAEGYSVTLEVPGAYLYKCNPHVSTGMVGAIVVGSVPPENLDALEASPMNKGMIGRAIRKLGKAIESR